MKKIVVIASTSGSILSKVLALNEVKQSIFMVVSDRECGAVEIAKSYGIKTAVLCSNSGEDFSNKLVDYFFDEDINVFISFYTRLLSKSFLDIYRGKVYNFHPSLLPACPGMDGFGDTVKSGAKYFGSTLHVVDEGIDTGAPVVQSIYPFNPRLSLKRNRHILFEQQCKIFIQFVMWLNEDRVYGSEIKNASYIFDCFSPNLENSIALKFSVDLPG